MCGLISKRTDGYALFLAQFGLLLLPLVGSELLRLADPGGRTGGAPG